MSILNLKRFHFLSAWLVKEHTKAKDKLKWVNRYGKKQKAYVVWKLQNVNSHKCEITKPGWTWNFPHFPMRSDTFTPLEHKVTRFPIPERPKKQHERASQGLRAAITSQNIEQVSEILPRVFQDKIMCHRFNIWSHMEPSEVIYEPQPKSSP